MKEKIQELIESAKIKYPVSVPYQGRLTEEDITELEKVCDVHCLSVYMDGSSYYSLHSRLRLVERKGEVWVRLR